MGDARPLLVRRFGRPFVVRCALRSVLLLLALTTLSISLHASPSAALEAWPQERVAELTKAGVPEIPLRHALAALACARSRGLVEASTLTLIDYSRPSSMRRLWVIDAATGRIRFHELVAHGRGSGEARASRFSNVNGSRQSSLGLFRTAETYIGSHGYSLRLDGLEPGVNDHARERAIVMHGADYVTPSVARMFGRVGRSWGCPAVDSAVNRDLIDTIRGGTAVFAYYPDADWLSASPYQTCETATASR